MVLEFEDVFHVLRNDVEKVSWFLLFSHSVKHLQEHKQRNLKQVNACVLIPLYLNTLNAPCTCRKCESVFWISHFADCRFLHLRTFLCGLKPLYTVGS